MKKKKAKAQIIIKMEIRFEMERRRGILTRLGNKRESEWPILCALNAKRTAESFQSFKKKAKFSKFINIREYIICNC
jgi:hypothetical protein